jgi:hypothetical protein
VVNNNRLITLGYKLSLCLHQRLRFKPGRSSWWGPKDIFLLPHSRWRDGNHISQHLLGYDPVNETQPNAVLAGLLKSRNKLSRFSPSRDNSRLVGHPEVSPLWCQFWCQSVLESGARSCSLVRFLCA